MIFALATILGAVYAVSRAHDEFLWTKQNWNNYKLDFPYSVFNREDVELRGIEENVVSYFLETSLDGPISNLQELIDHDSQRYGFHTP